MSAQVLFNQLTSIDRLTRGGFSADQARASAEALGDALTETVATKTDLAQTEAALKADITKLEAALKADITELRADLAKTESALKFFK